MWPRRSQCGDGLSGLAGVDEGDVLGGGTAGYEVGVGQVADGEEGLRGGARVDAGGSREIPGLERVVPGRAVGDCVVFQVEGDVGDLCGVLGEQAERAALGAGLAVDGELATFVGG